MAYVVRMAWVMWLATHVVGGGQHSAPMEEDVIQ